MHTFVYSSSGAAVKRAVCLLLVAFGLYSSILAQENLMFNTSSSPDATITGNRVEITFITPYEGFIISPSNRKDMVMKAREQTDGSYATQVVCDISDAAADRNHTFRVNISGTTIGDYVKVPLVPGRRFTVRVEQALEHNLYLIYPNSQRGYMDATKSAVEFTIPDYIRQPRVEFTAGIGRMLPVQSLQGQTVITLELDCDALKQKIADIPDKRAQADARLQLLQAELAAHERNFDENSVKEGFDFDADERKKAAIESAIEHVYDEVPELFIRLVADKANTVRVDPSRITALTQPRNRLQISVVDGLHRETVYKKASFGELLGNARDYLTNYRSQYKSSYYDAAVTAYDQAIAHDDCPADLREPLRVERDTLAYLRKFTRYHEKADTLVRENEQEKGFDSEEVYNWLLADHKFLNLLIQEHPEMSRFQEMDIQVQERINMHPSAMKAVQETVVKQAQRIKGKVTIGSEYLSIPLNTISVYAAPYRVIKKNDRDNLRLIGRVDANGEFNVIMPQGMHYIILDQEMERKSEAHYVSENDNQIEITIK